MEHFINLWVALWIEFKIYHLQIHVEKRSLQD